MARGQLILIEGLDRAGKSTQCDRLSARLGARLMKFPDRDTAIGQLINLYLTDPSNTTGDETMHLLFLANRWELVPEIERVLALGTSVVMDRYVYLGIAYSLAKQTTPQMASAAWLMGPDRGLPKPDLTLFLTLDLAELGRRKGWGDERYEKEQFQAKVKTSFERVLASDLEVDNGVIEVIDVNGKLIEQVETAIWTAVEAHGVDKPTNDDILRFNV